MTNTKYRRTLAGILAAAPLALAAGIAIAADAPVSADTAAATNAPAASPAAAPSATAAATSATTTPTTPPAAQATTKTAANDASDPVVCKRNAPLGSRLSGTKECMRRSEWAARAKESRDSVDRMQRGATASPPDKNMGGG